MQSLQFGGDKFESQMTSVHTHYVRRLNNEILPALLVVLTLGTCLALLEIVAVE